MAARQHEWSQFAASTVATLALVAAAAVVSCHVQFQASGKEEGYEPFLGEVSKGTCS